MMRKEVQRDDQKWLSRSITMRVRVKAIVREPRRRRMKMRTSLYAVAVLVAVPGFLRLQVGFHVDTA